MAPGNRARSNYPPPSNLRNFTDYPPRNRAGKTLQLPRPSNLRNFTDYPPRNRAGKTLQLPPSNLRNFTDYPPRNIWSNPRFQNPGYGPVPSYSRILMGIVTHRTRTF